MKTLAIDTATKTQTLALTDGAQVVARRLSVVRTNHSATLLSNIDDMLVQAEWEANELELLAVGLGPGTFTGLRVGLATAKAIAKSAGAAIVGVSSLEAMARPISSLLSGTIVSMIDARRGEVYCAAFTASDGQLTEILAPCTMRPDEVRSLVSQHDRVAITGNGLAAFDEFATWDANVVAMPQPWHAPSSVSIALLAQASYRESGSADIASLEPNYVRPSDAEKSRK